MKERTDDVLGPEDSEKMRQAEEQFRSEHGREPDYFESFLLCLKVLDGYERPNVPGTKF
jgi:hypothetical protein